MSDRFTFEVSDSFELKIWDAEYPLPGNVPNIIQPTWPDSTEWASLEEASEWATVWIDSRDNPETAEFVPGFNPSEPKIANPELAIETPTE